MRSESDAVLAGNKLLSAFKHLTTHTMPVSVSQCEHRIRCQLSREYLLATNSVLCASGLLWKHGMVPAVTSGKTLAGIHGNLFVHYPFIQC